MTTETLLLLASGITFSAGFWLSIDTYRKCKETISFAESVAENAETILKDNKHLRRRNNALEASIEYVRRDNDSLVKAAEYWQKRAAEVLAKANIKVDLATTTVDIKKP